jgi:hypothetical protein
MSSAGTLPVYSTKSGNQKARHGSFSSSFVDSSIDVEKSAGLSASILPSPTSTVPVELSLREADTPEDLSSLGSHDQIARANYSDSFNRISVSDASCSRPPSPSHTVSHDPVMAHPPDGSRPVYHGPFSPSTPYPLAEPASVDGKVFITIHRQARHDV